MSDILVQIIFGWPAILTSLLLSAGGLVLRKPWLLIAAGVLAIPFSWYLSGYPAIRTAAALLPLFQFVAAWALQQQKKALAWVLVSPLAIITVVLAVVVLRQ